MPGLIYGSSIKEIAHLLYCNESEECFPEVPGAEECWQERKNNRELYEEIKLLLPNEYGCKLARITDTPSYEFEQFYTKGFFDGLAIMQALMYMARGCKIDGELSRVLDGFYCTLANDGPSEGSVRLMSEKLKEMIEQRDFVIQYVQEIEHSVHLTHQGV